MLFLQTARLKSSIVGTFQARIYNDYMQPHNLRLLLWPNCLNPSHRPASFGHLLQQNVIKSSDSEKGIFLFVHHLYEWTLDKPDKLENEALALG